MFNIINYSIYKILESQVDVLRSLVVKHNNYIDLQKDDCDTIWGYCYIDDYTGVAEYEIKAILLDGAELVIILDDPGVYYSKSEALNDTDHWYYLDSDCLLYAQTMLNILECIEEYVD